MTPAQNNTPTVYVVDDDRPMRDSLVGLITAMGFSAQGFASAGAFHRFYRRQLPGCLVLDVRMPVQSGLELYEQLIEEGKRLPVIFITAHADVSTAVAAMKTGAVEFLEKPFDRETLQERVQRALALDADWRRHEAEFNAIDRRIARLNERDKETVQLIISGASNKVMASPAVHFGTGRRDAPGRDHAKTGSAFAGRTAANSRLPIACEPKSRR